MEQVYVLVRVRPSHEKKVGAALKELKACVEVHPLFGEYDFILKLEGEDHSQITRTILADIRALDGVASTKTLVKTAF